ncbi:hypothetical protein F4809DRAFT_630365 [Biscogniauxia mediterranea]|nr:hypothetical protein F4809DRAFT_630365 [Biscogniauxia mediterranea]
MFFVLLLLSGIRFRFLFFLFFFLSLSLITRGTYVQETRKIGGPRSLTDWPVVYRNVLHTWVSKHVTCYLPGLRGSGSGSRLDRLIPRWMDRLTNGDVGLWGKGYRCMYVCNR